MVFLKECLEDILVEPIKLKTKDDYSEHLIIKMIDGKPVELVSIDELSEGQWQRYCRETGTVPFKRFGIQV